MAMNKRLYLYAGGVLIVIITFASGFFLSPGAAIEESSPPFDVPIDGDHREQEERAEGEENVAAEMKEVVVDVKGEVKRPGVYVLTTGERVDDAIRLAGGVSEHGSSDSVNFAKLVEDEMIIYVPHEDDIEENHLWEGSEEIEEDTVNINAASESELQTLPGIGPAKASAIVQYREEHGNFKQPADVQNVSGIGEKSYAQLEEQIAVD